MTESKKNKILAKIKTVKAQIYGLYNPEKIGDWELNKAYDSICDFEKEIQSN